MTLPTAQTFRRLLPSFSLVTHSEEGFLWLATYQSAISFVRDTDLTVGTDHYLNLRPQVKHKKNLLFITMKGHIL